MRTSIRPLLVTPLLLLPCACAGATPSSTVPPTSPTTAPMKTAERPKLSASIPDWRGTPSDHFARIQAICKAASTLDEQRGSGKELSAGAAVGGDPKAAPKKKSTLHDLLDSAKADFESAPKLVTPPVKPLAGIAPPLTVSSHSAAAAQPAARTLDLSAFARSYGEFLQAAREVHTRCQDARTGAGSEAIRAVEYLLQLPEIDVRALRSQAEAFEGGFRLDDAVRSQDLTKALEKGIAATAPTASSAPSLGLGSLESLFVQGLADFAVTRAKAEAVLWTQKSIVKEVCNEKLGEALSHTCSAFRDLDSSLSIQAMGVYLQTAALADLEALPAHVLSDEAGRRELAAALRLGILISREVYAGKSPLDVLRSVQRVACDTPVDGSPGEFGEVQTAACAASVLVDSVLRQKRSGGGVSVESPGDLSILAVTALKETLETLATKGRLPGSLDKPECHPETVVADVQALIPELEALERDLKTTVREAQGKPVPASTRLAITSRAVAAFVRAAGATTRLTVDATCSQEEAGKVLDTLAGVEAAASFTAALFNHDAAGLALAAQAAIRALGDGKGTQWEPLLRVLPLVVEIASAKKSADVATALEAAAAPVGSYKAKFDRNTLSVNAFVGGSLGPEFTTTGKPQGVVSVFAPIGLHATTPLGSGEPLFHVGIFASVIDLGALVATRLDKEVETTKNADETTTTTTVDTSANVGFAQVFSPGLFVTLGLGRSPFVLGAGASVTPDLRKAVIVTTGQAPKDETFAAVRGQVFLALDLTLLPF